MAIQVQVAKYWIDSESQSKELSPRVDARRIRNDLVCN